MAGREEDMKKRKEERKWRQRGKEQTNVSSNLQTVFARHTDTARNQGEKVSVLYWVSSLIQQR